MAQINNISVTQSFKQYATTVNNTNASNYNNALTVFTPKEDTQGSPYLFDNWMRGKIELVTNQTFQEKDTILNYDKTVGKVIMQIDGSRVIEINMEQVKSFLLESDGKTYQFDRIESNVNEFGQKIFIDSLSSLYKVNTAKFYKADYVNKGLYETGYRYDRYVDAVEYRLKVKGQVYKFQNIDKSTLRKICDANPLMKKYLSQNSIPSDKEEKESYLIDALKYLAQNK